MKYRPESMFAAWNENVFLAAVNRGEISADSGQRVYKIAQGIRRSSKSHYLKPVHIVYAIEYITGKPYGYSET